MAWLAPGGHPAAPPLTPRPASPAPAAFDSVAFENGFVEFATGLARLLGLPSACISTTHHMARRRQCQALRGRLWCPLPF